MSKDFEQAYKDLMQAEAPDLWNRIEAGLESKSAPEEKIAEKEPKKKVLVFRRYSGLAAAMVCAAVIIPAFVLIRQTSKGYSASDTAEAIEESFDTTADSGAGAALMNETAAAPADEATAGGIMEEAEEELLAAGISEEGAMDDAARSAGVKNAAMEDLAAESEGAAVTESTADALADSAAADMAGTVGAQAEKSKAACEVKEDSLKIRDAEAKKMAGESSKGVYSASSESAGGSQTLEIAEGTVFEHVIIKVTEMQEAFYRDREEKPGALYTAELRQDMAGLAEGEQIVIYAPAHFSVALFKGGVFEVDLEYENKEKYPFVLQGYYREVK
ncbi:MAG: hypothetical protein NC400_12135 [Clostridium sp.]|nr:hypothetical protein [Clostridium sp.]